MVVDGEKGIEIEEERGMQREGEAERERVCV